MSEAVTIWTLGWVPEVARGFVRDIRLRWACEEAGIPYRIKTIAFDDRETNHLDQQPFGQVPMLEDGDIRLFESGAGLLHLGRKSSALMSNAESEQAEVTQWTFAALNSIEMVTMPWVVLQWANKDAPEITDWMAKRLNQMEAVLREREWLVGDRFTLADLIIADVLRVELVRRFGNRPASEDYISRVTSRPSFQKALSDQCAHYQSAEQERRMLTEQQK